MRWAGMALFMSILMAGCASRPERQVALPITVPERWMAATQHVEEYFGEDWADWFEDEELNALIGEALERNYDLRAAAARMEAARAEARIARAELSPRLGLTFDAARRQQAFVGLPLPGAEGRVLTARSTSFGLSLNSSWELDLWGRVRAGRLAAGADLEAVEADVRGARHSLAGQTARLWVALLEAGKQVELARSTAESYRATAGQVEIRYERGVRSPLDLRLALASLAGAEALLAERTAQYEWVARQLEILLGRYPAGTIIPGSEIPKLRQTIPVGLPSDLLQRRPDVAAAERIVAGADARLRQARASLFPRISLTASGGTISNELADLLSPDFGVWTLAGNLAQPIFEGGRLRAGVDLSRARVKEALENYASVLQRAFGEVETALVAERWLGLREAELERAVEQSRAAQALAEERYFAGLENFATVLEAQRRMFEMESKLLLARRLRFENRIDLHLALGGAPLSATVPRVCAPDRPGRREGEKELES
jgi:outer membrane protein, multidrug efflux system